MDDVRTWEEVGKTALNTFLNSLPGPTMLAKCAGGGFLALGAALFLGQRYIIYPAYAPSGSRKSVPTPDQHGIPIYEDITLDTPDKLKIKAYLMLQGADKGKDVMLEEAPKRPTILFLHANAGNMGHRLPFAHIFYDRLKCNVFMLSYRGYGLSEGSPSEAGIRMDAQLALDYITSHPLLEKTKIIIYGQSIGGAVAIDLTARNVEGRIAGAILENTFLSLSKVATESMPIATPYIWLGLLREKWNSERSIANIPKTLPCLFLSGSMDEIVPPEQFLKLHEICPSSRKRLRQFAYGTHNDTCVAPGYWQEIQKFLKEEIVAPGSASATNNPQQKVHREGTFDERRMKGAEKELEGTIGAGSIAP